MNAGVRISPRCIAITPVRAAPSVAETEKEKRGTREASDDMRMIEHHRRNRLTVIGHAVTAPYIYTGRNDRALGRFIDEDAKSFCPLRRASRIVERPAVETHDVPKPFEMLKQLRPAAVAE
jgi:hypothetical protein